MNTNAVMRDYFDRLAPDWQDNPAEEEIRERLVEMAEIPENAVIADIGCGKGVMLAHLLRRNPAHIHAVDISGEMLRLAREQYRDERISFVCGDLMAAALPPLDAAVIFNAYPHFMDKTALRDTLARQVKPGGAAVIMHSRSRAVINGRHSGGNAFALSVPLEEAAIEAARFAPDFSLASCEDSGELYFIRLVRR